MITSIDDLITEIFDEYPQPRLICTNPGDYTPQLVSQLKRTARTRLTQPRPTVCSYPIRQKAQTTPPPDCRN